MSQPILLDTCALIWLVDEGRIAAAAEAALEAAQDQPGGVVVSPISAWEIGRLAARGRIRLGLEPRDWFQRALDAGLVLAPMPPELLIAASFLPENALRDPADRIMAATARAFRYRLMTRDRPLLDFGAAGHLEAIAC
ncbi:MAG TPA: type II toxin-antitoxin system VapC family toxin [Caulobacteraceae bacterium]|nr:type II toxin-antitoxin system VapC family toxin [Caulobacteraceae bacterium]